MRTIISSAAILAIGVTVQAQEQDSSRKQELYDLHDVIGPAEVQAAADKDSGSSGVATQGAGRSADAILHALRALLSPNSKVELSGDVLAVRATEEEQKSVREFLDVFRRRLRLLISIEVRVLQSAAELWPETPASTLARLSAAEAEQLQQKPDKAKAKVFAFPKLTLTSGQEGSCDLVRTTAYLSDWSLSVDSLGRLQVEPEVDVTTAGIMLKFRPVVKDAGKKEIVLDDLKISLAEPRLTGAQGETVFRTMETPFGKVETPDLKTISVTLNPVVTSDETLLAGPFSKPWSEKGDPKVWVQLRTRIDPTEKPAERKEK